MFRFNLRTRIYFSMLAILALAFLVTGVVAIYNDVEQNKAFNQQALEKKEKSVRASLDYFLRHEGGHMSPDSVAYKFGDKICELADVHDMFIGLFDLKGEYLISNNSAYLDSLQIPEKVPAEIVQSIQGGWDKKLVYDNYQHKNYTLAYWLFTDMDQHPIAIIAMDYSNLDEESKDVKDFLLGISGSYIVLFFIAAFLAFFLSRYITRSLRVIAAKMKSTDLQKNFEPLSWDSNDEIGNLVLEYNKMLAALQQGADKLAENEREGAWREMAQQIAHDIKNPLTPMRLRVQHLARQFDNGNNVQFSDQLKVFIQSMTEQIDTLANIANTFAQLAKTEELPLMTIDVDNFIQHQIDLFKDENTQIVYCNHYTGIGIQAENNSLSRIFSNLITNAIQAKKEDHSLTLTLNVWKNKNQVFIRINDNGTGIPKELLGNLFQPRFTTKTTGSGIGLATAKALMEKMNGQIKCKSKINQGTSFFLVFPITSSTLDTK
ncbi:MAG: hypothetical protein RL362_170 [Bacteroidota bacterium]